MLTPWGGLGGMVGIWQHQRGTSGWLTAAAVARLKSIAAGDGPGRNHNRGCYLETTEDPRYEIWEGMRDREKERER